MSGSYGYGMSNLRISIASQASYDPGDPPFEAPEKPNCPECAKLRERLTAVCGELAELLPRLDADDMQITNLSRQLAAAEAREKALRDTLEKLTDWGLSSDDVVAIARAARANAGTGLAERLQMVVQRARELIDNPPDCTKHDSREWAICDIGRYDALVDAVEALANTGEKGAGL